MTLKTMPKRAKQFKKKGVVLTRKYHVPVGSDKNYLHNHENINNYHFSPRLMTSFMGGARIGDSQLL